MTVDQDWNWVDESVVALVIDDDGIEFLSSSELHGKVIDSSEIVASIPISNVFSIFWNVPIAVLHHVLGEVELAPRIIELEKTSGEDVIY